MNYFIFINVFQFKQLIKRNLTDMSTLLQASVNSSLGPNENTNLINRVRNSTDVMTSHPLRPLQMLKEANA